MFCQVFKVEPINESCNMQISGGYFLASNQNLNVVTSGGGRRGQNFPCTRRDSVMAFESETALDEHLVAGDHVTGEVTASSSIRDRVKSSWVTGLNEKVQGRKTGPQIVQHSITVLYYKIAVMLEKLKGEKLVPVKASTECSEGWALYNRPAPDRLAAEAKKYAEQLFEDGRRDRNARVTPESAEEKMKTRFPNDSKCWLSVKQVSYDC